MTGAERSELAILRQDLLAEIGMLDEKVDAIERRLDRWDGAITLVKTIASVLGVGGIALILAAFVRTAA